MTVPVRSVLMDVSVAQVIKTVHVVVTAGWYKSQFVYCREMAPGTASLPSDWVRGNDSKHYSIHCSYLFICKQLGGVPVTGQDPEAVYQYLFHIFLQLMKIAFLEQTEKGAWL